MPSQEHPEAHHLSRRRLLETGGVVVSGLALRYLTAPAAQVTERSGSEVNASDSTFSATSRSSLVSRA